MLKNIHPSLELLSNVQSKWDFFSNSWGVLRISELYKSWKTIKSFHFIQIDIEIVHIIAVIVWNTWAEQKKFNKLILKIYKVES